MEWVALEFVLVWLFVVFVVGRAILEFALVLVAPTVKRCFDGPHIEWPQRHEHIHQLGFIARRVWLDRARRIRRPLGHLRLAC
jgi:hypothetical protein